MPKTDLTADQAWESLTGFDELAISQYFDHTIAELAADNASMFGRALAFVVLRREEGAGDEKAWREAMEMPIKQVNDGFFAEVTPDAVGKAEEPEPLPETSLISVS